MSTVTVYEQFTFSCGSSVTSFVCLLYLFVFIRQNNDFIAAVMEVRTGTNLFPGRSTILNVTTNG